MGARGPNRSNRLPNDRVYYFPLVALGLVFKIAGSELEAQIPIFRFAKMYYMGHWGIDFLQQLLYIYKWILYLFYLDGI